MNPRRDYKQEYAQRIQRGAQKGLSRSQSRGHPKAREPHASPRRAPPAYDRRLEHGLQLIRNQRTLTGAARDIGVSPERLRHYVAHTGIVEKQGRRWVVTEDRRTRQMLLFSAGQTLQVLVSLEAASLIGRYMAAVGRFLETNDPVHLQPFAGQSVVDVYGTAHPFETRPNVLYRLDATGGETFEQVYRIVA